MLKNVKIVNIVLIVVIVALSVLAVFLVVNRFSKKAPAPTTQQNNQQQTVEQNTQPSPPQGGVEYTENGFTPNRLRFRTPAVVFITFTNNSDKNVNIQSDPHPSHTSVPELNIGVLRPGEVKTIPLEGKFGEMGYHNHLNPEEKGSFEIIQE